MMPTRFSLQPVIVIASLLFVAGGAGVSAQPVGEDDGRQRVRDTVRQVLASPEFAELREEEEEGWWQRFTAWLQEKVGGALSAVVRWIADLPAALIWVVVGWMVLTLLAIAAHLIWTVLVLVSGGTVRRRGRSAAAASETAEPWLGVRELRFEPVYEEARALAERGQWSAAVRHLYVAMLLWLDRRGRIVFRRSKTNRDYLREVGAAGPVAELLRTVTRRFELVAYGGMEADRRGYEEVAAALERIRNDEVGRDQAEQE